MMQTAPIPNSGESMHEAVIAELQRRKSTGLENYKTILQTWNDRDAEQDAIEEAADLMVYMMQSRLERADLRARIKELEALTQSMADRIEAQSGLLGKKAERDKLHKAIIAVKSEIEHKHGGPESSAAVSVPYLYKIVMEALGLSLEPRCGKCDIKP